MHDCPRIDEDDVVLGDTECGQHRRAGDAGCASASNDHAHVHQGLALNLQPIEDGRPTTMAVLIVMKTGMDSASRKASSTAKHSGALISSRLIPPKVGATADHPHQVFGASNVEFQIERIDVRQSFEQK